MDAINTARVKNGLDTLVADADLICAARSIASNWGRDLLREDTSSSTHSAAASQPRCSATW